MAQNDTKKAGSVPAGLIPVKRGGNANTKANQPQALRPSPYPFSSIRQELPPRGLPTS
ncbi:hypothetical protein WCP94_000936 [Bilophila wadsworthia]